MKKCKGRFLNPCWSALLCGVTLLLAAGCCPKNATREPWYGDTLDTYQVVQRVNANNQLIPTLWATTDLKITVADENGSTSSYRGNGTLQYRRPMELFMTGTHISGAVEMFEMGSNADDYWLIIPELKKAWWGRHRNVGKPCVLPLPIRPDLLVEVLGVSTTNVNLLEEPAPVMRFNHDEYAYMFVWQERVRDRWIASKEIWYDLNTLSPTKVLLFDTRGRTIVKATLSDHKPIKVPELPQDRWPKLAHTFELEFPATKAKLEVDLDQVYLTYRDARNILRPNNGTFMTPEEWDSELKVIQVDKDCRD